MGLFELIFGKRAEVAQADGVFKTLTAYQPAFRNWDGRLYESELVRAAIHAKANHISKLTVTLTGAGQPSLQTKLKVAPNEWQTWGQFLYRLSTILDAQNTAFIVPVIDRYGQTTGIYPVLPSSCELRADGRGEPILKYKFQTGDTAYIELAACGVMTKFQYKNDIFGETNSALYPTMDLINIQNQGISEGVKSAATYRFMARLNNFAKPEDLAAERKRFSRENLQSDGGGVLLFPNNYSDIRQIDSKPFVVDAAQMEIINANVYRYFGVNEDVLQNRAFGDSWAAFYEGSIEPFAIQLSDVITKMLFTLTERQRGNCIAFTSNRLQYASTAEKLNVSAQMADRGIMNRDEIRAIWNLPPLPNGEGQTYIVRGEYKNANDTGDEPADNEV